MEDLKIRIRDTEFEEGAEAAKVNTGAAAAEVEASDLPLL